MVLILAMNGAESAEQMNNSVRKLGEMVAARPVLNGTVLEGVTVFQPRTAHQTAQQDESAVS
jgi:hypothetical protein